MKDFTTDQLNTILDALASHVASQKAAAAGIEGQRDRLPADMQDMPERLLRDALTAERLRSDAAAELHRRGRSSCELAHPGRPCPLKAS